MNATLVIVHDALMVMASAEDNHFKLGFTAGWDKPIELFVVDLKAPASADLPTRRGMLAASATALEFLLDQVDNELVQPGLRRILNTHKEIITDWLENQRGPEREEDPEEQRAAQRENGWEDVPFDEMDEA